MSAEIQVPPSQFNVSMPLAPNTWQRGIPVPGISGASPGYPPVNGNATCRNLFSSSPPTLLEVYEIYSYTISWGVAVFSGTAFPTAPEISTELAFLVNDSVRYMTTQDVTTVRDATGLNAVGSGAWVSDLVNPIEVGARERLSLRLGLQCDLNVAANAMMVVGAQLVTPSVPATSPFPSTISYRTLAQPGARRL